MAYKKRVKYYRMSVPEIAESIGCSERTVAYDLDRGMAKAALNLCRLLRSENGWLGDDRQSRR